MFPHIRPKFRLGEELRHKIIDFADECPVFFIVQWDVIDFRGFRQIVVGLSAAKRFRIEINDAILETQEFRPGVYLVNEILVVELFTHLTHNIILETGGLQFGTDVDDTPRPLPRGCVLVGCGVQPGCQVHYLAVLLRINIVHIFGNQRTKRVALVAFTPPILLEFIPLIIFDTDTNESVFENRV